MATSSRIGTAEISSALEQDIMVLEDDLTQLFEAMSGMKALVGTAGAGVVDASSEQLASLIGLMMGKVDLLRDQALGIRNTLR